MTPGDFDLAIMEAVSHRPWPMPDRPWVMTQTWHDLLFAHWAVEPRALRPLVPAPFELDIFSGQAWVGVVPFLMANVSLRGMPALPWISEFAELNVRTYTRVGDRPGVFFFSLDAARSLAVVAARALLNLPYHTAEMGIRRNGIAMEYECRRLRNPPAALEAAYEPSGSVEVPEPGTLEYFLTERYCLYNTHRKGRPYRLEIHHPPWRLQPARARFASNTMAAAAGIALPSGTPLLHFSKRQDAVAWGPTWL